MELPTGAGAPEAAPNLLMRLLSSRFNYWAEFVIDLPFGVFLFSLGLRLPELRWSAAALTIVAGIGGFTLLEYAVHRWLFHGKESIFTKGHDAHHKNPLGYDAMPFFVPAIVLLSAVGFFPLFLSRAFTFMVSGVIAIGYVTYGLCHFAIHHAKFHNKLAIKWAANHRIHHHHPDKNFGVTTPLWDHIFRSKWVSERNTQK
jgi:sterol desaturase/sphingolipid hydroxylase (fatty acid hydroxylase superfamily)